MKKSIVCAILLVMMVGVALTACSTGSGKKSIEGKYVSPEGYIQMNKDGTFEVSESQSSIGMDLTGKYTLNGKNIVFNVEKMNGEELGNTTGGSIDGNVITGPDGKKYTKQ